MSTVQTLTAPRILLTGTRVLADGTTQSVTDYDITNEVQKISDLSFRKVAPLIFRGDVTVTMTSDYALKNYSSYNQGPRTFIGEFTDNTNISKAEIRYTVNGKNPTFTKSYIYGNAITLRSNKSGSDGTIIKARVYRRGQWSDVTQVTVRIQKSSDLTF